MTKYNVTTYAVVRVKVCGIEAASQEEAIAKSDEVLIDDGGLAEMFPCQGTNTPPEDFETVRVENGGYAEDVEGYVVDESGDPNFSRSAIYDVTSQGLQVSKPELKEASCEQN